MGVVTPNLQSRKNGALTGVVPVDDQGIGDGQIQTEWLQWYEMGKGSYDASFAWFLA